MSITPFTIDVNTIMPGVTGYDLKKAIDKSHIEAGISPIDEFISNGTEINKLFSVTLPPVVGNLIILGYVSAIESYFRAIFRRLILVDEASQASCEEKKISYGAILSNLDLMLPEALFEDISFAGKKNIIKSINEFLGLTLQESSIPQDLLETLNQFNEICELRHCIVHRFGKFGSRNAISLGLTEHKDHVEKPIKCDFATLQQFVTVCHNTVRITNNFLFQKILLRLIIDGKTKKKSTVWKWDYKEDRELFFKYFSIFQSKEHPASPSLNVYTAYNKYKQYYDSL